ncbi:MAG: glycerate kinase [Actinobacteria bacterium]|nr:glycerate kinase [Actinomycetota bacterium]
MLALASPASLKSVLRPVEAALALAAGLREGGAEALELPVADGGEGTAEVIASARGGRWGEAGVTGPLGESVRARYVVLEDGVAVVEAAEAIGLRHASRLDPRAASSRGLGELMLVAAAETTGPILVCLGDSATVDGGAGLLEIVGDALRGRALRAACDVRNPLLGARGAARAFGPQKGATPEAVDELEIRLAAMEKLRPYANLLGAGAAGGIGAALAALGAELVSGAELVLEQIGFRDAARAADIVVTGEGEVDRSTFEGKASGEVVRVCAEEGVRCVLFGGRLRERPHGVETYELPSGPERAAEDLVALGRKLAGAELGVA